MGKRNLTLIMSFKSEVGDNINISLNGVKENLAKEDINSVMDLIIAKKVFMTKGGNLISKVKADVIDKTTETYKLQ